MEYFEPKLTENALKVLERRYLRRDARGKVIETPKEMFLRVAKFIASADNSYGKTEEDIRNLEIAFYKMMANSEFMPNSPTLMNAGRELGQLSACFVLPIEDSMESIFEAIKSTAIIHKTGGGTGFDFSKLRPKNSVVRSTGGIASGPVSFMKVFDAATQAIKQGGTRRGANMGILRVDHPDILEFIRCKQTDKEITNFNISVALTEDFMQKLEKGQDYDLIDPHTGRAVRRLPAREVFDLIVKQAWKNGEPGIIFIDRMNEFNPTPQLGRYESTNPCITGEMLIPTEKGIYSMKRLVQDYPLGGIGVLNTFGFFEPTRIFRTGKKTVFRIKTKAGFELKATAEHPVLTLRGWQKVRDLIPQKDKIILQNKIGGFNGNKKLPFEVKNEYRGKNGRIYKTNLPLFWSEDLGILLGWLLGDGNLHGKTESIFFYFGKDDGVALNKIQEILTKFYGKKPTLADRGWEWQLNIKSKLIFWFFENLGVKRVKADKKFVPPTIFTAPKEAVVGFLKGLFSSDGTINYVEGKSSYIRLSSSSLRLLKEVQLLLLNLGIFSRIYENRKNARLGPFRNTTEGGMEKIYVSKPYHELEISRQDVIKFISEIGFISDRNKDKVSLLLEKAKRKRGYYQRHRLDVIEEIEYLGKENVYDLSEPITHSFVANGFVIHNCGEQVLLPLESCNLGSINLSKMVKKEGERSIIDWEKLRNTTHTAVHFLDNVIDMNKYPLPEIEEKTKLTRKIGLGVMGWADLLVQLGIPYNSEEAIKLARDIMEFILGEAENKSISLASERGVFPAFAGSIYDGEGGKRLRNATLTTIAPTGTISIIAGCSSGIEPLFALVYTRHVMDRDRLVEVNPYFERIAKERGFYSRQLMEKIAERGSCQELREIPEDVRRVFVTAHDIIPEWHIKMQAVFQRYTHNAVSKTLNFPHHATEGDVKKAYLLAYQLGCKGVTIYRDRSREDQVLNINSNSSDKKKELPEEKISPRPRPEVMRGSTTKITTGCGNLYITINEDEENHPFEVFIQMGKAGGCAASQLEAIGRLVSLALRSEIDPRPIIEQLKGIRCPSPSWERGGTRIFSCADAIARAVERRLLEKTKKATDIKTEVLPSQEEKFLEPARDRGRNSNVVGVCPDCGEPLKHEEGCLICTGCGYSKC